MRIANLYDKHRGETIYVVGTGPSMRVFPLPFLKGKTCIGLNQAWKYGIPLTYSLTVHPELTLAWEKCLDRTPTQWVVKKKSPMKHLSLDDERYYVFETDGDNYDLIRKRTPDKLFLANGIQCTALDLAARMGAGSVMLVGVDMGDIGGDHHGHNQHVQFHGVDPDLVYKEYRYHTAKVRKVVRDELRIPVMTLSPFLGADSAEEDYLRLCKEFDLPKLDKPEDVSTYNRTPSVV